HRRFSVLVSEMIYEKCSSSETGKEEKVPSWLHFSAWGISPSDLDSYSLDARMLGCVYFSRVRAYQPIFPIFD
ncbi:MAG: hypothetical protein WCI40_07345, partial [Verrucomicrobiota bacterium]